MPAAGAASPLAPPAAPSAPPAPPPRSAPLPLSAPPSLAVRVEGRSGPDATFDPGRWLASPTPAELRLLARARGPVLDVGCGPGRHVLALARRGVVAMGIDITPGVVALARHRGASVLERSVFGPVPGLGRWATVLLLDGNLGIGAEPAALLARVGELLAPGGQVLAEVAGTATGPRRVRLEQAGVAGPWFRWADVDRAAVATTPAGLGVLERWVDEGREFLCLERRGP